MSASAIAEATAVLTGPVARGLLAYLGGCLLCLTAGLGLLRVLRARLPTGQALLLAPGATLALSACALGVGIAWRYPVRLLAGPLWGLLAVLALCGAAPFVRALQPTSGGGRRASRSALAALALCVSLPVVLLGPHFRSGLRDFPGVLVGDGWSYVAYAQYLWELPRGASGDLGPLHAYASHLAETRHVSPGLLAFASAVEKAGDPQAMVGLFVALSLFQCACACAAFGRARGLGTPRMLRYLLLCVPVGWVAYVVAQSNYDQALALALHPLLAAVVAKAELRVGHIALVALVAAASLYSYPELFGLALLGAGVVACARWRRSPREQRLALLSALVASVALALILTAPYLRTAFQFVGWQVASIDAQSRPGGLLFDGLLRPASALSALWALGGESLREPPSGLSWRNALGLGLTMLCLRGGARLARRGRWEPALIAGLQVALALVALICAHYSYAAYKLLSVSCWSLGLCLLAGLDGLARGVSRALAWAVVGLILLGHLAGGRACRELRAVASENRVTIKDLRALEQVAPRLWPRGVLVNVAGAAAQQWALYFLRDVPLRIPAFRGFPALAHLSATMARARQPDWANVTYLLTDEASLPLLDARTLEPLETLGPFRLWRLRQDVALIGVTPGTAAQARVEHPARVQAGPDGLRLTVVARRAGTLALTARSQARPGTPARQRTSMLVLAEGGGASFEADGERHTVLLPASVGLQELLLKQVPERRDSGPRQVDVWGLRLALLDVDLQAGRPGCAGEAAGGVPALEPEELMAQAASGEVRLATVAAAATDRPRLASIDGAEQLQVRAGGDFDGDGQRDWLAWSPESRHLKLFLAGRPDAFAGFGPMSPTWEQAWEPVSARDLDGDGRADLVFQHSGSGQIAVWSLECGLLLRRREPTPAAPAHSAWRLAGAADVDADGRAELIFQHARTGRCALWFLDAELRRRRAAWLKPPEDAAGWRVVAAGALEAPRVASLLFSNAREGRWALARLRPDGSLQSYALLPAGALAPFEAARIVGPR